jgi:methyl-accepting chemotaxis protein
MNWFINLTTRIKLFFGFGLMILFLGSVVVPAYTAITTMLAAQERLYKQAFGDLVGLLALEANTNENRVGILTMMSVIGHSDQEAWHQNIKQDEKENDEIMGRLLEGNRNDPTVLTKLEEYKAIRDAYKQTRENELIPLINNGKIDSAKTQALGIQQERYVKMRSIRDDLIEQERKFAQAALEQSEQRANESLRLSVIVGLIAVVVSLIMIVFLNRIIATPLKEISGLAERVGSGDLTVHIPPNNRTDEIGNLTEVFRSMVGNLRSLTGQIRDGVNVVASSASEILTASTQIAAGATETATAVSETTATVEEAKQGAEVSSQKSKYVAEISQKASESSQGGRKAVEEGIEGMNRVREQMESIAESIVRLSEQGQSIGEIISTVNDLAEQSNLLAVNASIEAAKAGEQGKGFAVVAMEVKSLAEQSKQATAQVRAILGDIQKATSAAVMATEQGSKAVEAGMKQSAQAGESIRMLVNSIAEAAQAATQIAASSREQLVAMDQIASAMESIKQASAQNVAAARQAEAGTQNLHEMGQKLKQLIEQYRISS